MSRVARRPAVRTTFAAIALVVLVTAGVLIARSISDPDRVLLARSDQRETVLRSLRLAGIEHAVVGFGDGVAVVRIDVPVLVSASDATISSQASFATLAAGYPSAREYVVQLFASGHPLVEVSATGDAVRDAVRADDTGILHSALAARLITRSVDVDPGVRVVPDAQLAGVTPGQRARAEVLLTAAPEEATALPPDAVAVDVHLAGAYLDAKNRAAGLLGDDGPASQTASALATAAARVRQDAPGVRAPGPDERALDTYRLRLRTAVEASDVAGGGDLLADIDALGPDPGRAEVTRVRSVVLAIESLAASPSPASVLAGAHLLATDVAASALPAGTGADAVLAAADAPSAPDSAVDVRAFERSPELDFVPGEAASGALPERVLRLNARPGSPPSLTWAGEGGSESVAPEVWLAFERADGALYWLADEDGQVALTDASLRGWAFSRSVAALVDASRCGRLLATFAAE
ncbi:MAG: hypothetical protein RQ731_07200 [Anaerosomatales bacterium]|nr:hypothetical protein [Anaerosomatales bacterium]MDT8434522.1 hypothetical protein [Anaerosomatales bacterium]